MKSNKFLILVSSGILLLGACSSGNQATNSTSPPTAPSPATTTQPAIAASPTTNSATNAKTGEAHSHGGQGGQVIESGPYHLELVTGKEATGTHIDFFLQKGDNHEPIPNAKVTAQVQLPDGSQQSLPMKYDASGKHYYTVLPATAAGEYKVVVLSDIQGEKVNARYSFKQ
ncbi:MAG: hypothetical protein NW224_06795 [Leptolyngbyaceae cyanobacterium bins.302]|nr:hypothetical protein [Leptolyngbyaceae cyanobacterium bins.302]